LLPKVGLNIVPVTPDRLVEAAQVAERLGYDSVWSGEIIVSPFERQTAYHTGKAPFRSDTAFLEPFVALAAIATATTTVRLGTGIVVLPVRDPFLTARAIVTLDVLSGGRLEVGAGVGWMKDQSDIMRRAFSTRGLCMEEFLDVLDLLFTEDRPEYHGSFFDFPPVGFEPKPVQRPRPPLLLGGTSEVARRRAALRGDGYYGNAASPAIARDLLATMRAERAAAGVQGPFGYSAVSMRMPSAESLDELAEAGVERVVVTPWEAVDEGGARGKRVTIESIEAYAVAIGLEPRA